MIKCNLISVEKKYLPYKNGEKYLRAYLMFNCCVLGIFSFKKQIEYHVTMFENYENHLNYWEMIIKHKKLVPYKIIKDRKIF